MAKKYITILAAIFILGACKKDYNCECTDAAYGTMNYNIHDTKKNADDQCKSKTYYSGSCSIK